jgi:hypothetical protein
MIQSSKALCELTFSKARHAFASVVIDGDCMPVSNFLYLDQPSPVR